MNNRDKCLLAYLAGLIDGEGYIGISRYRPKNCPTHYSYKAQVSICMTDAIGIAVLSRWLKQFRFSTKGKTPNRKFVYRIDVQNMNDCYTLLKAVQPFLLVKWEQAKVMLAYLSYKRQNHYVINGWNIGNNEHKRELAKEYYRKCEYYYNCLRQMKKVPTNGVKTVELLNRMDLRQYRAELEDVEKLRKEVKNLLEGVETRHRDSTPVEAISSPEKDIVQ